jgi:hypothetical protein
MTTENKFYWDGLKMEDINGTTSTHTNISSNGYPYFPANFIQASNSNPLATQPSGFVSNTIFSNLPTPNDGYWFFTDDEDAAGEAPPFKLNGTSIFAQTIGNQRIRVYHDEYTGGSGTVDIPDWCNAIKIYYITTKGTSGTAGTALAGDDYNNTNDHDHNEHKNYDAAWDHFHHNHDNNHHNDIHHNYEARNGGVAGTAGVGKIGWFVNYIKITAGTNNKLIYIMNTMGTSSVEIKENDSITKGTILFADGGAGGDGGDGVSGTNANDHTNYDNGHEDHDHHHDIAGSNHGAPGTPGTDGAITIASISTGIHLNYNHVTTNTKRLKVYYFRYKTT